MCDRGDSRVRRVIISHEFYTRSEFELVMSSLHGDYRFTGSFCTVTDVKGMLMSENCKMD